MISHHPRPAGRPLRTQADQIDYNLIYAASFMTCLTVTACSRLVHWASAVEAPRKSVLQQARSDASTLAAFAFMQ